LLNDLAPEVIERDLGGSFFENLRKIAGAFDAFLRHYGHNTATLQSLQTTCVSARF